MNNENFHPVLREPPLAHALHHYNEQAGTLCYEYNGVNIISIALPQAQELGFRHGSDGSMQSMLYMQQIYVSAERPTTAVMTLRLTDNAVNMRPRRAQSGEAILGQTGTPLISGVNGLYDVNWDLLIDWHGAAWRWLSAGMERGEGESCVARLEVQLTQKPLFINLRPQYYRKHLGYSCHKPWERRPKQRAVAGWCSWEAYRRDISAEKLKEVAVFLEENLKDYGLTYLQVDDGYQKMPLPAKPKSTIAQGWLTCEESRFPNGHEGIVGEIQRHGLTPAIWTNANITNPLFPQHNPEAVLWREGRPQAGEWIDFICSCTPETLEQHIEPLFRRFAELGYEYIKIDAIRHLLFDGLHECVRLGTMSNEEAGRRFRAYMEATRRGMGESCYYLASWGEMGEVVGLADACRISMDANPTWAGIRMQLFESARWYHTQRILFLNDPDHVCVRTKTDWAKSVLSLISLSGELYMLSDTPDAYTGEKLGVIRKTLPPLTTQTAETGAVNLEFPAYTWTKLHGFAVQSHETPVEMEDMPLQDALNMAGDFPTMHDAHPFSSLWAFHLQSAGRGWCVAARIATTPLKAVQLPLKSLGLAENCAYLAFDFWEQKFLGVVRGALACKALTLGQCQIISLYKSKPHPQLIASSRHVSMDAVSVLAHRYCKKTLFLRLGGVVNTSEHYYLFLPEGFALNAVAAAGCSVTSSLQHPLLVLNLRFEQQTAELTLTFAAPGHETNKGGTMYETD